MADNETVKTTVNETPTPAPKREPKPAAKQTGGVTTVSETVVILTGTFDATKPTIVDEAETLFRQGVAEAYGDDTELTDVRLIQANHRVGHSIEYKFTGTLNAR